MNIFYLYQMMEIIWIQTKYISNKYSIIENNLINTKKENKKLIDDFKGKNKENANKNDLNILKEILKNKKIRKNVRLNFGF